MAEPTPLFPERVPPNTPLPDERHIETMVEWLLASVIFVVALGELMFIAVTA